ncbi:MAG TPA: hypothetical protein VFC63_01150 [Blastocatellia bacterium]|nr:hypothetical protein [Blastocatellia bacterium]
MPLRDEISRFDGRHVNVLEDVLASHRATDAFLSNLVILAGDEEPNVQTSATWLLKKLVESDVKLKKKHLIALFDSVSELNHWLPKLHICQMLEHLSIPAESKRNLKWFLEQNLEDSNKFLRAWTYNGFFQLAKQHREYFDYAMEQIDRGDLEEAKSIRARIRAIRAEMRKLPREE